MEFTVKEVAAVESKSVQEIEKELLEKHEQQLQEQSETVDTPPQDTGAQGGGEIPELKEEEVLSYIGKRFGKEIKSLDELAQEKQESEQLPEDVAAYLKYKKETGRGIKDFLKVNESFDDKDPDKLLAEYYAETQEDLDQDDINFMLREQFGYDEDLDEESEVKRRKLAKKKELAKAKKYFEEQREKYKAPLESSGLPSSGVDQEELRSYQEYLASAKTAQDENQKRYEWFQKKTDEVFSNEFKGFEFNVGDKSLVFTPAEAAEIKKTQSDITNFIGKYVGKDGLLEDAKGYHKALAVAMNSERFAKFFYEQGMADAVDDLSRKSKNINMDMRQAPQQVGKGGVKVAAVNQDSGSGLRIRSKK
jgi:uncharacterized protein (DUF2164 family)